MIEEIQEPEKPENAEYNPFSGNEYSLVWISYNDEETFSMSIKTWDDSKKQRFIRTFGQDTDKMERFLELRELEKKIIAERVELLQELKSEFKEFILNVKTTNPELLI